MSLVLRRWRFASSLVAVAAALILAPLPAHAHELRPAYLELREIRPGEFSVLWKTPMVGDARLALEPEFSGDVTPLTPMTTLRTTGAALERWTIRAPALRLQRLHIRGLESTMTDAIARIEFADGTSWTGRLTAREPATEIPERESAAAVAGVYFKLGVEHILSGPDHLLFVLALMLLTRNRWRLIKTITAFTVAHSLTLGLATLGVVRVPQAPVEAVIALSIVFVAAELLRKREGRAGLTARAPWLVAFTFGLLHGLGFAGALREIGLPQGNIPIALLFFNLGVEAGQLLFVSAVLSLVALVRRFKFPSPRWLPLAAPYAIGMVAMFWVIQRVARF
jgi:hydrogenase/urease accessory protein HupE